MRGEVEKTHMNTVFRAVISPRNTNYIGPDKHRRPDRHLTDIGVNFSPTPPIWCPPWGPLSES